MFKLAITFIVLSTVGVRAETLHDMISRQEDILYQGYASITTCVNEEDAYKLGPYLFVCDSSSYEYPYHYGDVILFNSTFVYQGHSFSKAYLCLEGEEECLEGEVYTN